MAALLREPLMHFVVLGALLFAADGVRARWHARRRSAVTATLRDDRIVVDEHVRRALAREDELRFGRPPDAARVRTLVDAWVRDEVLVREGLRLGLDRGDPIVRRRLVQKMELVLESEATISPPDDAALGAYLATHREGFRLPGRASVTQVFFARERRGANALSDAAALLATRAVDPSRGDAFPFGTTLEHRAESDLTATFGPAFMRAVAGAPLGTWVGPVESRFGAHLVLVRDREAARDPELSEVRASVLAAWTATARADAVQHATQRLVEQYGIVARTGEP